MLSSALLAIVLDHTNESWLLCQEHQGQYLICYASPTFCQLSHQSPEQLLGQHWGCFLHDKVEPAQIKQLNSLIEQRLQGQHRLKNYRLDNSSYWVNVSLTPLEENGQQFYLIFCSDISQKVATEHKLMAYKREIEKLQEKINSISPIDNLTQVLNRKHFDKRARIEWQRAIREQKTVTILTLDLDYFRNYNFTYGRSQGDLLLKTIAGLVSQLFQRSSDLIARYGGEEFVVLLLDLNPEQGIRTAETLRQQIEQEEIPFTISPLSPFVTVSIGVACAQPCTDLSLEHLLEASDTALARAKQAGRNRSELYLF